MHRSGLNKLLVGIVVIIVFFSFHITRYLMQRGASLTPEDIRRIGELEVVITKLQEQISLAEKKEQSLRTEIDLLEARAKENAKELPDGLSESLQEQQEPLGKSEPVDCKVIDSIKVTKTIAMGHTKTVQEGELKGRRVAIKSASMDGADVKKCIEEGLHKKSGECYLLANYKVLKEMMVLRQLNQRNIAALLGMCVRSENSSPSITERGVTLIVEIGEPVQLHRLLEQTWSSRVEICVQLSSLLEYLANSPMGSVALPDVRDEQFIMVGNTIKLSDVDDIFATEPKCELDLKCLFDGKDTDIKCQTNKKCEGMNAYSNMQRLTTTFFAPLLKEGCPEEKKEAVDNLLAKVLKGELDAGSFGIKLEGLFG